MSEPKSTAPLILPADKVTQGDIPFLPADKVTQGDIPLGLTQTSLRSRLSRMPHGRHIKEERKEK
jgi:hypothetical protein